MATVTLSSAVAAGQQVALAVSGVTNPPAGLQVLSVQTSSDTLAAAAPSYRIVKALAVVAPTLRLSSDAPLASEVTYTVGFTTSAHGGLVAGYGSITLVAPRGTAFPLFPADYSITDVSTRTTAGLSGAPSVVDGGSVVSVPVDAAIAAGQSVSLAVAGVINPAPGAGTITVETSSDSAPATTPAHRLVAAGGVARVTLSLSSDRASAPGTIWKAHFTTSSRGSLAAGRGVIVLAAPPGTVLPAIGADYVVSAAGATGAAAAGLQLLSGGATAEVTVPAAIAGGSPVSLVVSGVTNPGSGTTRLDVSTSSQPVPVPVRFVLAGAGTAPGARAGAATVLSVRPSSTAAGADLVSYVLRARTSAHGRLATGPAGQPTAGTITVKGPVGTRFDACPGGCAETAYLIDGQNVATPAVSADQATVTLPVPADIGPSQVVTVTLNGVTNPGTLGPQSLSVWTSAGPVPAVATFSTTAPGRVAALSARLSSPTEAAPGVAYTVRFRTGPHGALAGGNASVPGTVTLSAPAGTVFPDCFNGEQGCFPSYVIDGQPVAGGEGSESGNGSMVTLALPRPVAAGQVVVVSVAGVTNAPASGRHSFGLWTSSDPVPVRTTVAMTTPGSVSAASVRLSSRAAGASAVDYTVRLRTGGSGALAAGFGPLQGGVGAVPSQTLTLLAPAGTAFPSCFSYEQGCWPTYVINGKAVVPGGGTVADNGSMVSLALPGAVAAGQTVRIDIDEMVNPAAAGPTTMTVWTSSDPVPVRNPVHPDRSRDGGCRRIGLVQLRRRGVGGGLPRGLHHQPGR